MEGGDRPRKVRTTRWSVVLASRSRDDAQARQALAFLCHAYWYPVYAWVRRRGHSPEDAADLAQEFFSRLLERSDLARADPARGRFRSWLLTSLNNFLANEWDRARAKKRGGGEAPISLDTVEGERRYQLEAPQALGPDQLYQRRWALTLLDRVLEQLRAEQLERGKGAFFERVRGFLTSEGAPGSTEAVAAELGTTPGALKTAVSRLRGRYRELLCAEIAETVEDPREAEDEIRGLLAVLG
jgi:RNA polymerase sigma factor (sigma-70 family)